MRRGLREMGERSERRVTNDRSHSIPRLVMALLCTLAALTFCFALSGCHTDAETPDKVVEHVGADETTGSSADETANGATSATTNTTTNGTTNAGGTATIAYVPASGTVATSSYDAAVMNGVQAFATDNTAFAAKEYAPAEATDAARTAAVKKAVDEGAGIVVCSGQGFSALLPSIAKDNTSVMFLLVDASMTDANGAAVAANNVHCITFREQEAGYLAGYSLVKNGYRGIGFCGGVQEPSVVRYGYGFIQGAQAAAAEDGVAGDLYMAYWYSDTSDATDGVKSTMDHWYDNGVDIVFACNGQGSDSVLASASEKGKFLVGSDTDKGVDNDRFDTSAVKNLSGATKDALTALSKNNGTWSSADAGKTRSLGVAEGGVGLSTGDWRMTVFNVDAYNAAAARITSGEVKVSGDVPAEITVDFQLDIKEAGVTQ